MFYGKNSTNSSAVFLGRFSKSNAQEIVNGKRPRTHLEHLLKIAEKHFHTKHTKSQSIQRMISPCIFSFGFDFQIFQKFIFKK
jgi:hypothetical protein